MAVLVTDIIYRNLMAISRDIRSTHKLKNSFFQIQP
jgi:hypothetical protein